MKLAALTDLWRKWTSKVKKIRQVVFKFILMNNILGYLISDNIPGVIAYIREHHTKMYLCNPDFFCFVCFVLKMQRMIILSATCDPLGGPGKEPTQTLCLLITYH